MSTVVSLKDLVDALEEQSENVFAYLDRETGSVELISQELLSLAEEDPESIDSLLYWEREEMKLAIQVTNNPQRYLRLPNRFEIHEWQIMRDFSYQVRSEYTRTALSDALSGKGAFRSFRNQIANLDLWDAWNHFKQDALMEIALDWSRVHNIIVDTKTRAHT